MYLNLKQYAKADQVYQQAIRIWDAAGESSSELMLCLREYAYLCRKEEHFSEAERAEVQALGIQVRNTVQADRANQQETGTPVQGFRSKYK